MIKSELLSILKEGSLELSINEVLDELLSGNPVNNIYLTDSEELVKYKASSELFRHDAKNYEYGRHDLAKLSETWLIPSEYMEKDMISFLLERCKTDSEMIRVRDEIYAFQEHNQLLLLNIIYYLVDTMRKNNIVWGIGRGSSVASFCLYLIGLNKINPMKYDIDYREFLKETK